MPPAPEHLAWPEAAPALLDELVRHPGRLALVVDDPAADLLTTIGEALGMELAGVGRRLTQDAAPPGPLELDERLRDMTLLADIDILFAPELRTDPLRLLRELSRQAPRIAAWPGAVRDGRALYSEPGRPDRFEARLEDALVLRPRGRLLPTDLPFGVERIAA
jgi:hypothetical protein